MLDKISPPSSPVVREEHPQVRGEARKSPPSASQSEARGAAVEDRVSLGQHGVAEATYEPIAKDVELGAKYTLLRDMVVSMLKEQGIASSVASSQGSFDIATMTPEEARALIGEDGYFGIEQTSERIFQFAIGLAGNDPTRFAEALRGIERGFAEAEKVLGGTLPDISYATRDRLMEKLDEYAREQGFRD